MQGTTSARGPVLAILLALVLIASVGAGENPDSQGIVVTAVERERPATEQLRGDALRATEAEIDLRKLTRTKSRRTVGDLFAARSFYTPPPRPKPAPVVKAEPLPAVAPPPPPPPSAPPLPFSYVGMMTEDPAHPVYFLVKGDTLYDVKIGEVIDGTYRIDSVAGTSLRLIYLPMDIAQILPMGKL